MKEIVPEYEFSEEQLNLADALAAETGLEKTTAHILFARGVDTAAIVSNTCIIFVFVPLLSRFCRRIPPTV